MIKLNDIVVEVRSKSLNRIGQIVTKDLDFSVNLDFNGVGSWVLNVAADHPLAKNLKTPGSGIVASYRGEVLVSGPVTSATVRMASDDVAGTLVVEGASDDIYLWDRVIFPEPSNLSMNKQGKSHDVATDKAENLLYYYASRQLGQDAHPDRVLPKFRCAIEDSSGAGPTLTRRARFPVLGDYLRDIATPNGLGFKVFLDDISGNPILRFSTYRVRDRTSSVRMGVENNMAASTTAELGAPSVTDVVIAGQGQGTSRTLVLHTDANATAAETLWGRRIERFVDQRQTNDKGELLQAGIEALAEGGKTYMKVKAIPLEDSAAIYGRDWRLGDKITVIIDDTEYEDVVSGVALKINGDGVVGAVKIGLEEERDVYRNLRRRISHLERHAEVRQSSYTNLTKDNSPAGRWVRVAYCPGGSNGSGRVASDFTVTSVQQGSHDFLNFRAASLFLDCTITLMDYAAFNDSPTFTAARFVRDPSDPIYGDGYLELFVSESLARDGDVRVEINTAPGPHVAAWESTTPRTSTVTDSSWVETQVGIGTTRSKTLTLRNGWKHRGDEYEQAQYTIGNGSIVILQGAVDGSSASSDLIATLPPGYRPAKNLDCAVAGAADTTARITIEPNGDIKLISSEVRGFTPLTGIAFQASR